MAARSSWIAQGPSEPDLLWFQMQHRSRDIYSSQEEHDRPMLVRRADSFFWDCMRDDVFRIPQVMRYIEMICFGLVSKIGFMEYDHHLLTALAERWRSEIHSFHLSVGEATITLQDVEVLLGLRVHSFPVTGTESYPAAIDGYLRTLLGCVSERTSKTGIRLSSLKAHLECHWDRVDITYEEALQRARCHLAFLLAGCFFPDKSQNKIDLFVLRRLEDPEA
ncbi:protein MAIN-LIKE 2-like [Rutidosis leptorrhynchoides]|uniref:protein MAIN-LIKE 2-like n=1 Tax=Rutidosis leptorrhynchoides TaxID=125765 RepID=UPI003A98E655